MPSRASACGCSGSTASHTSSNARKERDEHHCHHPERARDPRGADLRRTAHARLLRLDRPAADPRMVGRRHRRRGDGRSFRRHLPFPHRVRRRRGRVPRGRATRAPRADVPEPPADAGVRGPRRADEADADDALRDDRAARHDDALRRRKRREGRVRARRRAAGEDRGVSESPSQLIDARIEELGDWRGEMLSRLRGLINEADPEVVEEWKWRGVPVWSHDGMICTGETYKSVVKLTFAKGASLKDPSGLFNSSLEGNTRRAIDIHEGDTIDEKALMALIRAAVALNTSSATKRPGAKA